VGPAWTSSTGFVGGTNDLTGPVHIGAREYDARAGRFISVDPLIDFTDPQQINGYSYANNTPVTMSDPDGLRPMITDTAQGDAAHYARHRASGCPQPADGILSATARREHR
jgi:RHS repeat-associated protein